MAEGENQNQGQPSSPAPIPGIGLGSVDLPPLPWKGFAAYLSEAELADLRAGLTNFGAEVGGDAIIYGKAIGPKRAQQFITGRYLLDEDGFVASREYNLDDPFAVSNILQSGKLGLDQKIAISQELKRVGFYGNGEISDALQEGLGWSDADETAWARLLDFANKNRVTWQAAIPLLGRLGSTGGGAGVRVSSDEDVIAYTRELFLQQLGRMPTKKEIAEAASFIRNRERGAYASNQQLPQTGEVAKDFAQKADPAGRVSYGLGKAMELAFQALGE